MERVSIGGQSYAVGDYIHTTCAIPVPAVATSDKASAKLSAPAPLAPVSPAEPNIALILGMATSETAGPCVRLRFFLRPPQTFHRAAHPFHESEVVSTNITTEAPVSVVMERCAVLGRHDWCLRRPLQISDEHCYLCISAYTPTMRSFNLLKRGPPSTPAGIRRLQLQQRVHPRILRRLAISVTAALQGAGDRGGLLHSHTHVNGLPVGVPGGQVRGIAAAAHMVKKSECV